MRVKNFIKNLGVLPLLTIFLLLTLGPMIFWGNRESPEPDRPMPEAGHITAEGARFIMDSGEPYILLDVRTDEEFARGHIPGAVLIPHTEIRARMIELAEPGDVRILVYCQTGRRSAEAAETLAALGYTNINDFGGINDWPYEIIEGATG